MISASRRSRLPDVSTLAAAAILVYALLLVAGQATGEMGGGRLVLLVLGPLVLGIGVLRPGWLVLGLVALPPGVLLNTAGFGVPTLTLLIIGVIGLLIAQQRGLPLQGLATLLPFLVILVAAFMYVIPDLGGAGANPAGNFRSVLTFSLALALLTYMLVRDGDITVNALSRALLVGVVGTAVIFIVQLDFQPWEYTTTNLGQDFEPGLVSYRTHFGYVMALGFCLAVAQLWNTVSSTERTVWLWVSAFLGVLVLFSYTRGAWLIAVVYLAALPLRTGRKTPWAILVGAVIVAMSFPLVQERLLSDLTGGIGESFESGRFATGRWGLWTELWSRIETGLPFGHGFGYMFSLSPETLFGVASQFTSNQNPFVYAHNDAIFLMLEFGLVGLVLFVLAWILIARAYRAARRIELAGWGGVSLVGGVLLTMFVAEIVDNGLFIRPLVERFFVVVGAVIAIAAARLPQEPKLRATGGG